MNTESIAAQVAMTSSVETACIRFCCPTRLGVLAQSPQESDAQPVRACRRPASESCCSTTTRSRLVRHPGDGPFEGAVAARLRDLAGEDLVSGNSSFPSMSREIVLQPVRKAEGGLRGHMVGTGEEGRAQRQRISTPPKR